MATARKRAASPHQPTGTWITRERRLAIYLRDRFICVYCGTDLHNARPANVTLDHLLPRCDGGTNEAGNLVTACRRCNCSRGARLWQEFAPGGAQGRILYNLAQPLNLELARGIIQGNGAVVEGLR